MAKLCKPKGQRTVVNIIYDRVNSEICTFVPPDAPCEDDILLGRIKATSIDKGQSADDIYSVLSVRIRNGQNGLKMGKLLNVGYGVENENPVASASSASFIKHYVLH